MSTIKMIFSWVCVQWWIIPMCRLQSNGGMLIRGYVLKTVDPFWLCKCTRSQTKKFYLFRHDTAYHWPEPHPVGVVSEEVKGYYSISNLSWEWGMRKNITRRSIHLILLPSSQNTILHSTNRKFTTIMNHKDFHDPVWDCIIRSHNGWESNASIKHLN